MAAPTILAYSVETVIAEKFEAMIKLSLVNSRMKDFYDLYQLACTETFDGAALQEALRRTFSRRGTPFLPDPAVFEESFGAGAVRQRQWTAFLRRGRLTAVPEGFADVLAVIRAFLRPLHIACQREELVVKPWVPSEMRWEE